MRRALPILVPLALLGLLAIVAVSMSASAQTPYPGTGDWIVGDDTTFTGVDITVYGNVQVTGSGHLSLTNVDLLFAGAGPHGISVSSNARLTISGGSVATSGTSYTISVDGRTSISNCDIVSSSGIVLRTWRAQVNNCSIPWAGGDGIRVSPPTTMYSDGLDISDNTINNATGYGIVVTVGSLGGTEVRVVCVGNNVSGCGQDGIRVSANTDKGRFFLSDNQLLLNGGYGIYVNLGVRVVEVRLDRIWAKNNTLDGLWATVSMSIPQMKYIDDLSSIGNEGQGVYINFPSVDWNYPVFRHWYIFDNKAGGVDFRNLYCATLEDSFNVNNEAQTDYILVIGHLDIYRTIHRKAMARVTGGGHFITSWRTLEFTATWQNGAPCRSNTVVFEDTAGERVFGPWTTNQNGYMGNHTEWDWRQFETRTVTKRQVTAYLTGGALRLTGPSFDFDRDFKEELVFFDNQAPDLVVEAPGTNHVQNTDNLTIKGTCKDFHSLARLVQVSFDPEPVWSKKVWLDAIGTGVWEYSLDPAPDGIYSVFVRAYDWANYPGGMYANVTILNVTVDTTAPTLVIIQPIERNTITNSSQITVLGTTDPDVVSLTINGEPLVFYGGTFNKPIVLNEGNNTIVTIATDYAGNVAKDMRYVLLDSIAPILVVSQPRPDTRTNSQNLTLVGRTDIKDVWLEINGEEVDIQPGGVWTYRVFLNRGWNTILIDSEDIAKNHRILEFRAYYDPDPPVINVKDPKEGDIINTSKFVVEGFTDTDIEYNQIKVDNISIGVNNMGDFKTNVTVLTEGPFEIVIWARDLAGNEAVKVVKVFIDLTAPLITNLSLKDGDIVKTHVLPVTGETEDDVTLYVDGRVVPVVDGHFSTEVSLDQGDNTILIRVTDVAGNTRQLRPIVTLDTLPPDVYLDGVLSDVVRTKERFYTVVGVTEATAEIWVAYSGDGVTYNAEDVFVNAAGEFNHPIPLGKNKTTFVSILSMDYAGNAKFTNFTVKKEEPEKESFYAANSQVIWGMIIVAAALVIAFLLTTTYTDSEYKRRLKKMGYTVDGEPAPQFPPMPPPPPPAAGPAPRQPPRPPRQDEASHRPPPRPPMAGE